MTRLSAPTGTLAGAARTPLFCDIALAARIERAEARLIGDANRAASRRRGTAGGFVIPVAGGVASFADPGSPYNKVAGLGFADLPDAAALDGIEAAFAAAEAPVQVELAHLADPALLDLLTARGYRLTGFENVLGRTLNEPSEKVIPAGIQVRLSDPDELDSWIELTVDAEVHPDTQGIPMEEFPRDVLEKAERDSAAIEGITRYLALRGGQPAGAASMRLTDGIAQLTGAATLPVHRRRGVQTALVSTRLADAAAAGAEIAVVTTQPGSTSQQNMQRRGFDLLYTRAVLVKQAPEAD